MKFSKEHEWIEPTEANCRIGITAYAQKALGDIVYVELPAIGRVVKQGEAVAVVESVKAASDVYAPVSGTITAVNEALATDPALVNTDPTGKGWFFSLTPSQPDELTALLDEAAYTRHLQSLG